MPVLIVNKFTNITAASFMAANIGLPATRRPAPARTNKSSPPFKGS